MPAFLARLAPAPGICPLPSRGWLPRREYARSPCTVGFYAGIMPGPLARLAPAAGICDAHLAGFCLGPDGGVHCHRRPQLHKHNPTRHKRRPISRHS
eukprot:1316703-Pyramimonas_sp.AAC.1